MTNLRDLDVIEAARDILDGTGFGSTDPDKAVWLTADVAYHVGSDDFTITISTGPTDDQQRVVHVIYDDADAFTEWVYDLDGLNTVEEVEDYLVPFELAYNQAMTLGHGNWHAGSMKAEIEARRA